MYNIEWDKETGGYLLVPNIRGMSKEIRPVFYEELDLLGFKDITDWEYPRCEEPLLWAETRRYFYRGELVAEAVGGGLYSSPEIKVYKHGLILKPVDLNKTVQKNKALMDGIVSKTLISIFDSYKYYKKKNYDIFYVAFSGGKDSIVLLDLVTRALPHDEFVVIFGDTGMEVEDTYKAVELAKRRWNHLKFYTVKSHYDATESWELFGPPSRTQRWCCSVHKSVPSLLFLRQLTKKNNNRALVFDGIRAEESISRSSYNMISEGNKHLTQTNCSPLLNWNTAELYLYIFDGKLFLNKAYRYGNNRVGCALCPMSSSWREHITKKIYDKDVEPFLSHVIKYSEQIGVKEKQIFDYIDKGKWKTRAGGRDLSMAGGRIIEQLNGRKLKIIVRRVNCDWKEWIKCIGYLIENGKEKYLLDYNGRNFGITCKEEQNSIVFEIDNLQNTKEDIRLVYLIKNIFNKVAYCIGCKTCMVECPTGALNIEKGNVKINEKLCTKCQSCIDMRKGCLVAKSLYISMGGNSMNLKGMNRYQTFGFQKNWLKYYLQSSDDFFKSDKLGNRQFDSFRVWLKESEIAEKNNLTEVGEVVAQLGADDIRTWAIIWTNLAYNSTIVRWYVLNTEYNKRNENSQLITMLGDDYSLRTRKNALRSLIKTFEESPIGQELGNGLCEHKGKTFISVSKVPWQEPDDIVLLYSLYKFAERMNGYYSFTLSELANDTPEREGISPIKLFGISQDDLKRVLQGLSFPYSQYIRVAFSKDLDNIFLESAHKSTDILKLFK